MSAIGPHSYRTVLGYSFAYPLITIIDQLIKMPHRGANEIQTSSFENGLSTAAILLTVTSIESMMVGAVDRDGRIEEIDFFKATEELPQYIPEDLFYKVEELITVRDAIAHNHLWKAEFVYDIEFTTMKLHGEPRLMEAFGNKRFFHVLDKKRRKTKLLGFNLFPSRINCEDVIIGLELTRELGEVLIRKELLESSIFRPHMKLDSKDEPVTLENMLERLKHVMNL